jgi:hypothetical protein
MIPASSLPGNSDVRAGRWRGIHWPLLGFAIVTLVVVVSMTARFTAAHGGVLYPLDDSYIHLALARTLSEAGVWGLLPDRPSAASSSPLWTVLLAAAAIVTPGLSRTAFSWVPLLGNVAAAVGLILFWRKRLAATPWPNVATAILVVIVPLPTIAAIGMEHVLHALLASMLAWATATALEQEHRLQAGQLVAIAVLSGLAVAARYETLALVVTVAAVAVWYRRWALIPAVLVPPAAVIAGFGWIWVRNGGWWVPNSFLLKTGVADEGGFVGNLFKHAVKVGLSPPGLMVAALIGALAILWIPLRRRAGPERVLLILGIACTGGQFLFGQIGWLNRYEAWLVALDGLAILLAGAALTSGKPRLFGAIALALLVVCAPRAGLSFARTGSSAHDREWEHFGPTYALTPLAGRAVLVNDIGVISYYGTMRPIDVFGLADNESLRLKREHKLDAQGALAFAKTVGAQSGQFQMCWEQMFQRVPAGWTLVEAWTGPRNVLFGDLTIGYYAEQGRAADELQSVLAKAPIPVGVRRFDHNSALVRVYNMTPDRKQAAIALCEAASMIVTGQPAAKAVMGQ